MTGGDHEKDSHADTTPINANLAPAPDDSQKIVNMDSSLSDIEDCSREQSSHSNPSPSELEKEEPSGLAAPEQHDEDETGITKTPTGGASLKRSESQADRLGKKKIIVVMLALCLVLFLAALDMTIVSTALPTMAAHFHASESGYSWMASSYLLANAACVPVWGKISDIWGRKKILLLANFCFLIGSLICALAISLAMIIAGRALQGVGGGGIIVLANICVSDLFSVRDRPMYYGIFGATWAIASALGPIIGGAFTTSVTWRWCFYINLPIGGISFVILTVFLKIESAKVPLLAGLRSIDWIGSLLTVGGTLMFLFGLEFGGVSFPWASPTVICLIVFGVVTWGLAMLNEWKFAKYPIVPTRLFQNWHNSAVLLVSFCHGFVFIAATYYLPLYFQTVLLATPILSGVYVLPLVLSLSVCSALTGIVIKKTGRYRELIVGGFAFMTLGFGLFINLQPFASWPRIVIYQLIAGIGVGPIFQAPLVALQANIHPSDMATATATFGFIRQTSAAMSIVLGTVIYQNVLSNQLAAALASSALSPATIAQLRSSFTGSSASKALIRSLSVAQRDTVLSCLTYTFSRMWIFYTVISGIGLLITLTIRPVELSRAHTFAKTGLEEQERARLEIMELQKKKKESKGNPREDV